MTHAAPDQAPNVANFGLLNPPAVTPEKQPRLNDTEIIQLASILRLNHAQNMALIRFIERLD